MSKVSIKFSVDIGIDGVSEGVAHDIEINCAQFCEQLEAVMAQTLGRKFPGIKFGPDEEEAA